MDRLGSPFKSIVFDFDGTLVDSMGIKLDAFVDMFSPFGPEIMAQVQAYQLKNGGLPRRDKFLYLYKTLLNRDLGPEELNRLASEFSVRVETLVNRTPYVPGALEFLDKHYSEMPMHISSAAPQLELERIIDERDMRKFFKSIHGAPTPKTIALREIMAQGGYNKEDILFVGDGEHDYRSALAVGCPFVGVSRHGQFFPDAIGHILSLMELEEIINF
jgi:phosphoglycolate phosphatase